MFNVGSAELLVIMVVALIVLGPARLPEAARQIGKTMREIRKVSDGFRSEMKAALDEPDTSYLQRPPLAPPPSSAATAEPDIDTPPSDAAGSSSATDDDRAPGAHGA